MPTGLTGSCPCCGLGEVEETTCDSCGREFCTKCGGIKIGELSLGVFACTCKPITLEEMIDKINKPHQRSPL